MRRTMGNPNELKVVNVRLVKEPSLYSEDRITGPEDAVKVIAKELSTLSSEVFSVLLCKNNGQPIAFHITSRGTLDSALASPREVMVSALLANAAAILIAHNHPGAYRGELKPSEEDRDVTRRMMLACVILGIRFLDHIITSSVDGRVYSFKNEGELERLRPKSREWER